MLQTFAIFETGTPSRYLQQLCRHFGRKVQSENDGNSGWVQFPFGRCDLTAEAEQLQLRASADDQGNLDQVVRVMTSHLERFAFRENPVLEWCAPSH